MAQIYCETPNAELCAGRAGALRPVSALGAAPVLPVNPLNEPDWNNRLPAHPERCFFHRAEWVRVLHETYGYAPCFFVCPGQGSSRHLLPLMGVTSWLSGRRGIGLPFTDFCPPLVSDPGSFQKLLDTAIQYGMQQRWRYLELRGGRNLLPSAQAFQTYYGHVVDLVDDERRLAAGIQGSVRRAIRKAERLGLKVSFSSEHQALREFYALQCRTRRKHGLPPQPFGFFLKLRQHILRQGKGTIVLARQGEKPVAGAIFFHAGEHALFKYGASNEAQQGLRGNDLVMWSALKHYASHGFRTLHLGRTSRANAGLRRFKLAWGAREQLLEYLRYDLQCRAFVAGKDEAFGWYNRLFRWLPLGASRWVGALAYRHAA